MAARTPDPIATRPIYQLRWVRRLLGRLPSPRASPSTVPSGRSDVFKTSSSAGRSCRNHYGCRWWCGWETSQSEHLPFHCAPPHCGASVLDREVGAAPPPPHSQQVGNEFLLPLAGGAAANKAREQKARPGRLIAADLLRNCLSCL